MNPRGGGLGTRGIFNLTPPIFSFPFCILFLSRIWKYCFLKYIVLYPILRRTLSSRYLIEWFNNWAGGVSLGFKSPMLLLILIWIRASLPGLRHDQLMSAIWCNMLPIVIAFSILIPLMSVPNIAKKTWDSFIPGILYYLYSNNQY
jgi:NADH:ubiquinone oxidoreductase subunit H